MNVDVCIVGGGPAGMVLGYLLGRAGISVAVLEGHDDFDRDFRGDTLHAGVMDIFGEIGIAEQLLELPHQKITEFKIGGVTLMDFSRLKADHPFLTMMAQSTFLDRMAQLASQFPNFHGEMGAMVKELVRDETSGRITGVRYRKNGIPVEVNAKLVIGCDGRGSRIRREASMEAKPVTDPIDVLWFRLPRFAHDPSSLATGALGGGRTPFILLERPDHYQIAVVIAHGGFQKLRKEGLTAFHERIREVSPELYDRAVTQLDAWNKMAFLAVTGSRVETWHAPGLLLIGDAAHVMTPIGGVGINYAIWDAVEAANVIVPAMRAGSEPDLAEIQRRRLRPTKIMQAFQRIAARRILQPAAAEEEVRFKLPWIARVAMRTPWLRDFPGKLIALGLKRTRVEFDFEQSS
ncbi:MAG: 2-polyprenyl-6-methoxyphenol hydroxylase-like FAD-dependent oxidoreductase [Verrucomicrobiales bacterium]|jgi:2-polyprenyl-6-methoxyphenol hydroxylase-like FAD-dependent oxidoreductase